VETFHIKVTPSDSSRDLRVRVQWRGTSTRGDIRLDSLRMRTLQVLVGLLRTNRLTAVEELILLGEHLFVSLFGAELSEPDEESPRALFLQAMSAASVADVGLTRVSLEIDANVPALGSWPWEYLFVPNTSGDPTNGFFLGDRLNLVLTRRYSVEVSEQWENIRPPLRILFVVLSPTAAEPPLTRIEYEAVLETLIELRDAQGPERIDLRVLTEEHGDNGNPLSEDQIGNTTRTSYNAFRNTVVNFDPHVVHIIGHGRYHYDEGGNASGQIAFPRPDSTANWMTDWDVSNALRDSPSLRLVFLQACESAATQYSPYQVISGLAVRLAQRNVPAVIAMHFQIQSQLANEFARAFYSEMKERAEIEVAMHAARRVIFVGGAMGEGPRGAFGLPVLYLRGSGALLTPLEVETPPARSVRAQSQAGRTTPGEGAEYDDERHGSAKRFAQARRKDVADRAFDGAERPDEGLGGSSGRSSTPSRGGSSDDRNRF
jgi:hypothetical protein